jgi:predicted molibdopterin-dependent oxidoreductase YjgC
MKNPTIKLTIDGIEVEIDRGRTILEAAQAAGVRIPTLCHDRRISPIGACCICVVQEKGKSELLPACFTPAKNGMEIITQSPEVFESRRLQLQLILLNHPMICPWCEKEGQCTLQNLIYEYGLEDTRLLWKRISFPIDDFSPLLKRDPNKCILCGRCVRICDEVQAAGELSFTQRGIQTSIDTDFHRPLRCEFCGQCLDTCPVGAITSDCFDYKTKVWELQLTTSPCPYCACGCLLTFGSKKGDIKQIFSEPDKGPNDGNLCVKGRFGWDFVDHPDRIKTPQIKVNGAFREASWDEALRFVFHELEKIKNEQGSEAIGAMVSNRLTNEEYYLLGKLFKDALGTNRVSEGTDGSARGLTEGLAKTLGYAASTNSIREIRHADCILIIGADPSQSHPIIKNEIHLAIRRKKAQLIVVGSYDIDLSRTTQVSPLSPPSIRLLGNPGEETALLKAMVDVILKEGLEDKKFIAEKTEGLKELSKELEQRKKKEKVEVEVEVEKEIEKAARAFASAKKAMILIGSGVGSYHNHETIAIASSNLALLTGHLGKESSGILVLLEKCNSQGAIDMGVFSNGTDLLREAMEGKLKALYVIGKDVSIPSEALQNLKLLVVQDLFMTEAVRSAHVIFPACSFVEKKGTYTNLERRVQNLTPLRNPLGESRSDFDIFLELLRLFEHPIPGETPKAIFEEIGKENPHYRGLRDGDQWPKNASFLYKEGFPNGKAKLIPVKDPMIDKTGPATPFSLVQRPSLFQSGRLSLKSEALEIITEKPSIEIHPLDAQSLNMREEDLVEISNPEGLSMNMPIKVSSKIHRGVLATPYPCSLVGSEGIASVKMKRIE